MIVACEDRRVCPETIRSIRLLQTWSRSKLIQTRLTEPDAKFFMNLTKFGSSHETFDGWPEPKSLIERPSPSQLLKLLDVKCCVRLQTLWHVIAFCWELLNQSLKPVKRLSRQLPTFLLFSDHRSVAQQCCIRSHSSCNIVGATHAHYTWFPYSYGLYPSHDALQVPTLLELVASVCTLLPTRT